MKKAFRSVIIALSRNTPAFGSGFTRDRAATSKLALAFMRNSKAYSARAKEENDSPKVRSTPIKLLDMIVGTMQVVFAAAWGVIAIIGVLVIIVLIFGDHISLGYSSEH